jgi:hypothetical protein
MPRIARTARCRSALGARGGRSRLVALAALAGLATLAPRADAQRDDVPLPPRLDRPTPTVPRLPTGLGTTEPSAELDEIGAPAPTAPGALVRPPNAARLAALPDQRADSDIEEIVVLGGNWRLPDLGSAWRARQQAAELGDGPHVTFLPLYDPERPTTYNNNVFILNRELTRVGYIDLFRVRFGKRTPREEE